MAALHAAAQWWLPDGRAVTVRPVQPQDLPLAADFVVHGLSQPSRYQRFQTALQELSPAMAQLLVGDVDGHRHVALLAQAVEHGRPRQIGEVRYVRDDGAPLQAEFALAVADAWQGLGLGARLLGQLVRLARRQGVRQLYGDILRTNQPMLALARAQGFMPQRSGDARLARLALDLPAPPCPTIRRLTASVHLACSARHAHRTPH